MEEVLRGEFPERDVVIERFDIHEPEGLDVGYRISFKRTQEEAQADNISNTIERYFVAKVQKYIKILRSAVGGELRSISLSFTVLDENSGIGMPKKYEFIFPRPSDGQVKLDPKIWIDGLPKNLRDIRLREPYDKHQTDEPS